MKSEAVGQHTRTRLGLLSADHPETKEFKMIRSTKRTIGIAVAVTATGALLAGCSSGTSAADSDRSESEVVTLQFSSFLSPGSTPSLATQDIIAEIADASDGTLILEPFWEGALLSATDSFSGISQGRADLGYIAANYAPAEMPLMMLQTVPFVSPNNMVSEYAIEKLLGENEALQNEFSSHGLVPLGVSVGTNSLVASTEPIPDVEWFDDKSIRATGYLANLMQESGANAVALPVNEVYEAMERGLVNGFTASTFENYVTFSYQEVGPHVTDAGTGPFFPGFAVINQQVWDGLSDSHQTILSEAFATIGSKAIEHTKVVNEETCDVFAEIGGSVTVWPEDEVDAWKEKVGDSILNEWKTAASGAGQDADAFLKAYQDAIEEGAEKISAPQNGMAECASR